MSYEVNGNTYEMRPVSLYVEDKFRELAFSDDGKFDEEALTNLARDREALNTFMGVLLIGPEIDWYMDVESDTVGDILNAFFTMFAATMKRRTSTDSDSSPSINSKPKKRTSQSPKGTG